MTSDLGFWMAMFTLGALAYYGTPLGNILRAVFRQLWLVVSPSLEQPRDVLGRFAAIDRRSESRSVVVTTVPVGNDDRSASESDVPNGNDVTTVITIDEAVRITSLLTQGMSPSNVTKELPGYSARRYAELRPKVDKVREILATIQAEEVVSA